MKTAVNKTVTPPGSKIRDLVMRHLEAFQNNDLPAVIADYSDNAVLLTRDAIYTGPQEIRSFFERLMIHFPRQKGQLELENLVVNDNLVYIVWHASTPTLHIPMGTDTFIINRGKICQQT